MPGILVFGILVFVSGGPPASAAAISSAAEPTVRVLLLEGADAVVVEPAGAAARRVRPPQRGARLRFEAPGPHRVEGRRYRGAIEIRTGERGMQVVNEVPLEAYVAGTLLGEVHEVWGEAVLRAQAVAIRSYALHRAARAGDRPWDLEADTRGQVYLGADGESPAAWEAVRGTRGQVLAWEGEPILAAFHATAGGRTASAAEVWGRPVPYLVSVDVEGEEISPDTYWRAELSPAELERAAEALGRPVGPVQAVEVVRRTPSGRCETLRLVGRRGSVEVSGRALREALGARRIRSTLFTVRRVGGTFVFAGSGFGHGVGMSQWGARVMAERGADYRAILARFYPGARLARLASRAAGEAAAAPELGGSR